MASKYKNVRVDGIDSKREAKRKRELELMQEAGIISDLRFQVPFELIPAQYESDKVGPRGGIIKGKCIERAVHYYADFVYKLNETGETVVEDAKGYKGGEAYAFYKLKRKLMLWVHGIRIVEV